MWNNTSVSCQVFRQWSNTPDSVTLEVVLPCKQWMHISVSVSDGSLLAVINEFSASRALLEASCFCHDMHLQLSTLEEKDKPVSAHTHSMQVPGRLSWMRCSSGRTGASRQHLWAPLQGQRGTGERGGLYHLCHFIRPLLHLVPLPRWVIYLPLPVLIGHHFRACSVWLANTASNSKDKLPLK